MFHSEQQSNLNNPWFAVSMGLIGIIVGYMIGASGTFSLNAAPSVPLRDDAAQVQAGVQAPSANVPPVTDDDHIRGDADAKITVVEYSDFECPFCERHHPTLQQIVDAYDGDVNWVYRHFPLTSIHPNAQKAAEASECAADQGGNEIFWAYADALYALDSLSQAGFEQIARDLKLDLKEFNDCLSSGQFADKVSDMMSEGAAAGVQGTPANFIVVNDSGEAQSIDGAQPLENFKSVIDQKLQ